MAKGGRGSLGVRGQTRRRMGSTQGRAATIAWRLRPVRVSGFWPSTTQHQDRERGGGWACMRGRFDSVQLCLQRPRMERGTSDVLATSKPGPCRVFEPNRPPDSRCGNAVRFGRGDSCQWHLQVRVAATRRRREASAGASGRPGAVTGSWGGQCCRDIFVLHRTHEASA